VTDLFGTPPSTSLDKDPERRGTGRLKAAEGHRYLVPASFALTTNCEKCGSGLIGISLDGEVAWLDGKSIRPAGRNASTARLHSEVCP
jgi:hypothetical protein